MKRVKSKKKKSKKTAASKLISFSEYLNREKDSQKSNGGGKNTKSVITEQFSDVKEEIVGTNNQEMLRKMQQSKRESNWRTPATKGD